MERRAREEWTPDLSGWHQSADEADADQHDESGSHNSNLNESEAREDAELFPPHSKTASPNKKSALPFEHGYRVGNYNVSPSTNVPVIYRSEDAEGHLEGPSLLAMVRVVSFLHSCVPSSATKDTSFDQSQKWGLVGCLLLSAAHRDLMRALDLNRCPPG